MKIEYDPVRDLLYISFAAPERQAAKTMTLVPGVHADLNKEGKLIGIEVLDALEVLGGQVQFEVALSSGEADGFKKAEG